VKSVYQTVDGDVLDLIVWRHYGNKPGALEHVLEANAVLRKQPALLVPGTLVTLPDYTPPAAPTTVRLWT